MHRMRESWRERPAPELHGEACRDHPQRSPAREKSNVAKPLASLLQAIEDVSVLQGRRKSRSAPGEAPAQPLLRAPYRRCSAFSASITRKTSAPIASGGSQYSSASGVVPNQVFMKGR